MSEFSPHGVNNIIAFTGMLLWEVSKNHHLNDYQICEYHNIERKIGKMTKCEPFDIPIFTNRNTFLKHVYTSQACYDH